MGAACCGTAGPGATEGTLLIGESGKMPLVKRLITQATSNRAIMAPVSVGAFMCCSAGMLIVNKEVVARYDMPVAIVDIQLVFTAVVLSTIFFWTLRFGNRRDVLRWVKIVPWLYFAMLATSMIALRYASMGLLTVVRNVGPLVAMPVERVFNEPIPVDIWSFVSLGYILVGVCLYVVSLLSQKGGGGAEADNIPLGLALMVANMVLAMFERLYQRKMIAVEPIDVSKTGMLLLNNAVSVLPTTILFCIPPFEEYKTFDRFGTGYSNANDYFMLFLSCVCGVAIGWTAINAQQYVTATTMLVVTNINKIVVVVYGMLSPTLHEPTDVCAILGVCIALSGGIWYAMVRKNLGDKAKAAKEAQKAAPFVGKSSSSA